jgi:hypothetical protein
MRHPSLLSAHPDLDLLYSATRHFRQYMGESPRNKAIASLITSMYDAAAKFVAQDRSSNAFPGPVSATAANLADYFSDIPGENSSLIHVQTSGGGAGEGGFDYSHTGDTPLNPTGLGMHSPFVHAPTNAFPFDFQGNYRMHHEGSIVADDAWLAAQHGGALSTASLTPHALGISVGGNGWEDWFWQNDNARYPQT